MIINFDKIETTVLNNYHGGKKELQSKKFSDDSNRIMRNTLVAGGTIGMHMHDGGSEMIICLKGTGKVLIDDKTEILEENMCHYCPKGHSHSLINDSDEDLLFYAIVVTQ